MEPADHSVAVKVAKMYYLDQLSKSDIATRTGLSRFKVARILTACLDEGIVTITINAPAGLDDDLSHAVATAFGLHRALVVAPASDEEADLRAELGRASAQLLSDILTRDDVLGVGWGRTLSAVADHLGQLPPCPVVQMTGVTSSLTDNSVELSRRFSAATGGPAYPIFAPLLLPDAATAAGLIRQPDVAAATAQFRSVTKAIVAVGSWDPPNSQLRAVMTPREREELKRLGVQAEVCGSLLDADGKLVTTDIHDRMVTVGIRQLRDIPEIVAVAGGQTKQAAILAALRSGLVTSLVTDQRVAEFLLAHRDTDK